MFSRDEIERYARHLVLPELGGPGQQKLKAARVLVLGAGGLGAPLIQYLAAAGIGTIGIVDDDHVALSNLQRQVIHDTGTVGVDKVESARRAVTRLNPHVRVETHALRLDAGLMLSAVPGKATPRVKLGTVKLKPLQRNAAATDVAPESNNSARGPPSTP